MSRLPRLALVFVALAAIYVAVVLTPNSKVEDKKGDEPVEAAIEVAPTNSSKPVDETEGVEVLPPVLSEPSNGGNEDPADPIAAFGSRITPTRRPVDYIVQSDSPQEAAWLRNHGYPTADQWARRNEIPEAELERRSAAGDLIAMAMLAERYTNRPGLETKGFDLLAKARDRGSVFAVSLTALEKSRLYAQKEPVTDPALQQRHIARRQSMVLIDLTVAMMLGDRKAVDLLSGRALHPGIGERIEAVYVAAAMQMDEIAANRREMGLQPLVITSRP